MVLSNIYSRIFLSSLRLLCRISPDSILCPYGFYLFWYYYQLNGCRFFCLSHLWMCPWSLLTFTILSLHDSDMYIGLYYMRLSWFWCWMWLKSWLPSLLTYPAKTACTSRYGYTFTCNVPPPSRARTIVGFMHNVDHFGFLKFLFVLMSRVILILNHFWLNITL